MVRVHQYNELQGKWEVHEFDTRDKAIHYVASYRVSGWTTKYIYMEGEK